MKAVVVHEDMEFAARADAILHRVCGQAGINIELTVLSWSVDALNEKGFARIALVQAQDAHLIVLSARLAEFIPRSLLRWLERWTELRQNPEVALGIFDDIDLGRSEASLHPALSEFLYNHGLVLIRNRSLCPNDPGTPTVPFRRERQSALPAELYHYGNLDQPAAWRRFGINE